MAGFGSLAQVDPLLGDGGELFPGTPLGRQIGGLGTNIGMAILGLPKAVLWDLPHKAIQNASQTAPGLRREDFTDVPANTAPDPNSPLGGVGVPFGRIGWQPVDPLVGNALEAGMNVMGGTALTAPAGAAGAGPVRGAKQALDLSTEARLARAAEQGFDTDKVWYHSALQPVERFDRHGKFMGHSGTSGIHLTDNPKMASRYLDRFGNIDYKGDPFNKNVMPVYVRPGNVLERQEPFRSSVPMGAPIPDGYVSPVEAAGYDALLRQDAISARGGVRHVDPSARGAVVGNEMVLTDPSRVRSVHAAFDPENAGKNMLLGAGAADKRAAAPAVAANIDTKAPAVVPQYIYHSTAAENADSIAKHGLKPRGEGTYFAPNEKMMRAWSDDGSVVYRVDRSKVGDLKPESGGSQSVDTDSLITQGRVPPSALEISMDGGKTWGPVGRGAPVAQDFTDWYAAVQGAAHGPITETPAAAVAAAETGRLGPGGGGTAGVRGLPEAQAAAARWAGTRKPLEGIPGPLKIGEDYFVPGPIGRIHDVAEEYMRAAHPNRPYTPPSRFHPIDEEHSRAIAQAYEEMKHTPNDPATIASYNALIDETAKQYEAIKKTGLKIEPIPPGMPDPYAKNPRLAAIDVAENNHLWFFPTEGGFGTVNKITDNPMLRKTGEKIGDHELLANDMFRVVHDYFGHLKQGHGFRAAGEDNAWRGHAAMYSDLARPAMTTETRGQNSWVNYGPHGDKNRTASGADTIYADQKVGLMPEWTMRDRGSPDPVLFYHGSPHSFDQFDFSKIGTGEGNQAFGHGLYFAGHEPVSEWYRMQLATRADPLLKKYKLDEVGHVIGAHLAEAGGDAAKLAEAYAARQYDLIHNGPKDKATENAIKEYGRRIDYLNDPKRSKGHVYQVAADVDPAKLLSWDDVLKEQTPYVQERVEKPMRESVERQIDAIKQQLHAPRRPLLPGNRANLEGRLMSLEQTGASSFPGKEIYKRIGLPAKTESEGAVRSSQRLRELGIPGHRYSAGSLTPNLRGATGTPPNYVFYGDELLKILRKYGIAGLPAGALGFGSLAPREE